jgi:hypothetical protein
MAGENWKENDNCCDVGGMIQFEGKKRCIVKSAETAALFTYYFLDLLICLHHPGGQKRIYRRRS